LLSTVRWEMSGRRVGEVWGFGEVWRRLENWKFKKVGMGEGLERLW
jgi:hypothetical protein